MRRPGRSPRALEKTTPLFASPLRPAHPGPIAHATSIPTNTSMIFALPRLRIQSNRNLRLDAKIPIGFRKLLTTIRHNPPKRGMAARQGLLTINIALAFRPENRDPAVVAFAPGACSIVERPTTGLTTGCTDFQIRAALATPIRKGTPPKTRRTPAFRCSNATARASRSSNQVVSSKHRRRRALCAVLLQGSHRGARA